MRRLARLLAAALMVVTPATVLRSGTAHAAAAAPTPGVTTGTAGLDLLAQSPFVESNQSFHLQLAVTAPSPTDRLQVVVGQRITTRSGFDSVLKNGAGSASDHVFTAAASALPADAAGGIDVDIPINPAGTTTVSPFTISRDDSGVFPVTVAILDGSGHVAGTPLTTFMVYASPSSVAAISPGATTSGLPRLDVALSVPVRTSPTVTRSGQVGRIDAADSAALSAEVSVLAAHPAVPITLAATPATLDGLAAGTATDKATLDDLASLAGGVDQVALAPYTSASLPALAGADLGSEIAAQLAAGGQVVQAELGHPAAAGTLTVPGPIDQTTLADLNSAGVDQVVVPANEISALPSADTETTLASPTALALRGPATGRAVSIDPALTNHFAPGAPAVLAASRLLAELAMIQLEAPGEHRGVAVVPPTSWTVDPTFLATVLTGLTGNPLLDPVTTTDLFGLPELGGQTPVTRSLVAVKPTVAAYPLASQVRAARQATTALSSIFPAARTQAATMAQSVLVAESAELAEPAQRRLVTDITASLARVRKAVNLPGGTSITLTARDGEVPITVVASNAANGARVRLRFTSEKLVFRPFQPAGGTCSSPTIGREDCELTLASEATTLKIPVVARASGVFTMGVALTSPDGTVVLGQTRDTVRSTAFSGVGVVIMVVAVIGLAYWWIRNIRHGRRARSLVPPSDGPDEPDDEPVVEHPDPPYGEGSWIDDDPVIADFFSHPAPTFPPGSGPRGPSSR